MTFLTEFWDDCHVITICVAVEEEVGSGIDGKFVQIRDSSLNTVEDGGRNLPISDFLDAVLADEDVGFMYGGVEHSADGDLALATGRELGFCYWLIGALFE